jgi:hypothetical protein
MCRSSLLTDMNFRGRGSDFASVSGGVSAQYFCRRNMIKIPKRTTDELISKYKAASEMRFAKIRSIQVSS